MTELIVRRTWGQFVRVEFIVAGLVYRVEIRMAIFVVLFRFPRQNEDFAGVLIGLFDKRPFFIEAAFVVEFERVLGRYTVKSI